MTLHFPCSKYKWQITHIHEIVSLKIPSTFLHKHLLCSKCGLRDLKKCINSRWSTWRAQMSSAKEDQYPHVACCMKGCQSDKWKLGGLEIWNIYMKIYHPSHQSTFLTLQQSPPRIVWKMIDIDRVREQSFKMQNKSQLKEIRFSCFNSKALSMIIHHKSF